MTLLRARGLTCVVTDRRQLRPDGTPREQVQAVVAQARAAAAAGVDLFQIRERDLGARELSEMVAEVLAVVSGSTLRVLVNDRLDVALGTAAHGVHLPGTGLRPDDARLIAPRDFLVGHSIHAEQAASANVEYALFGTVFSSRSKEPGHPTTGVEALAAAARRSIAPVLAIGGITAATMSEVAPFCAGVGAIGWFATTNERRMFEAVTQVRRAFDTITPLI